MVITFTLNCLDSAGKLTSANTTLTVTKNLSKPTVALSASSNLVAQGARTKLIWSSKNTLYCKAIQGGNKYFTRNNRGGTALSDPITGPSLYQISCTGNGGTVNSKTILVNVLYPTAHISAIPTRVVKGHSTTVSWNASNVKSCSIARNGKTWLKPLTSKSSGTISGSKSDTITEQTIYKLTCINNAGTPVTSTQIVNVAQIYREF